MKASEILDKPELSVKQIANRHGVTVDQIARELNQGIQVELEHTSNKNAAKQIALNHLAELPDYYTRLAKMEKPHLYLDMDGVQADFFGRWARQHGHSNYKQIGSRSEREQSIHKLSKRGDDFVEQFFADLPLLPGGARIIQWLQDNRIPYTVLTAPMVGSEEASKRGKATWLKKHNPSPGVIYSSDKAKYARSGNVRNVLVDDFGKYIDAWRAAGGIAIKHSDDTTDKTIQALTDIYL